MEQPSEAYTFHQEDRHLFVGRPGESTLSECSVYSIDGKTFTRLNPKHDMSMLCFTVMKALPDRNVEEILHGGSKGFIARDRDFWREPSRERILRAALAEALRHAKNKEVPPDETVKVWELILKDTQGA